MEEVSSWSNNLNKVNFNFENPHRSNANVGAGQPGQAATSDVNAISSDSTVAPSHTESEDELDISDAAAQRPSEIKSNHLRRTITEQEKEDERRHEELQTLARRLTTMSHQSSYEKNPFEAEEDSVLNPNSPNFQPRAFATSLLNLQARDPEKWKLRTAGFSFKDLNVYGFGSATDFQNTVVCGRVVVYLGMTTNS